MTSPFISIAMPNYNNASFLKQAIQSVLSQTYEDFELIIVDDGSTDHSQEIISEYKDPRIRAFFQEHRGNVGALNHALSEARGVVICLLDADDWWTDNKLNEIVKWDEFLSGHYGILQHNLEMVWENKKSRKYRNIIPVGDYFDEMKHNGRTDFFIPSTGLIFRKEVIDKICPIPMSIGSCADAYLTRTSIAFGKSYYIPEILGYYRQHNSSTLANKNFNTNDFFHNKLFPALNEFYEKNNLNFKLEEEPRCPKLGHNQKCDAHEIIGKERVARKMVHNELIDIKKQACTLFKNYILLKWQSLSFRKVALFGAGKHTEWLLDTVKLSTGPEITMIMDDHVKTRYIAGLPVMKPTLDLLTEFDAIIISSDIYQNEMTERCQKIFGNDIQLINLYADLSEPGPYPK